MRISPISFNCVNCKHKNQNFKGITRQISKEFVEHGSFGGGQGDYNRYRRVIEYRPFADETKEEIENNINKIEKVDIDTPTGYALYPDSDLIDTEVVVGERLHCTKEEANLITTQALRKTAF